MPPKRKVKSDEFVVSDDEEVVDDAASAEESPAPSDEQDEDEEQQQPKKKKAKSTSSGKAPSKKNKESSSGSAGASTSSGSWEKDGDGQSTAQVCKQSQKYLWVENQRLAEVKFPDAQLTGSKRVTISNFRGKTFVDVREYYSDKSSGEMKPGKKGIALNLDDWAALKDMMGEIDSHIN